MKLSIKDSEFRKMDKARQEEVLRDLVRATHSKPNGEIRELDDKIRAFEVRFRVSSADLKKQVSEGTRREDWEVCQWLMLLNRRDLLGSTEARAE